MDSYTIEEASEEQVHVILEGAEHERARHTDNEKCEMLKNSNSEFNTNFNIARTTILTITQIMQKF